MVHQLCNICIKLGSCFSGLIECLIQRFIFIFDKAQAGETPNSAEFLFVGHCDIFLGPEILPSISEPIR